jgi:hypothetical protein
MNDSKIKRAEFVQNYVKENQHKQMKVIVEELKEIIFINERQIYKDLKRDISNESY